MHHSKYNRIYIRDELSIDRPLNISSSLQHYLTNVLRLKHKEFIRVFNETSGEYIAHINFTDRKNTSLLPVELLKKPFSNQADDASLIAAPAIIKNENFNLMVEKSVELGITELSPIICQRSQTRSINILRVEKIATEAVEQSEQLYIPKINKPELLESFIKNTNSKHIIVCNENTADINSIAKLPSSVFMESIAIIIGPEGGFNLDEQKLFNEYNNIYQISLSSNILRAETAMLAAIVQVKYERTKLGMM